MPYKDKEKYNEYMRNRRKPDKDVNPEHKPDLPPLKPLYWWRNGIRESLKECPKGCYVLSDGQVHDPGRVPEAVIPNVLFEGKKNAIPGHIFLKNLKACNENTKWTGRFSRESFERLGGI